MKTKDLKELLADVPDETEVCVFDWRKSLSEDYGDGEGTTAGIYPEFTIEDQKADNIPEGSEPWVSITFDNPDYDNHGLPVDIPK